MSRLVLLLVFLVACEAAPSPAAQVVPAGTGTGDTPGTGSNDPIACRTDRECPQHLACGPCTSGEPIPRDAVCSAGICRVK